MQEVSMLNLSPAWEVGLDIYRYSPIEHGVALDRHRCGHAGG